MVSKDSPKQIEFRRQQQLTLNQIRKLGTKRFPFPVPDGLKISIVCSRTSQVIDDFKGVLADMAAPPECDHVHAAMNDPHAIASKIGAATGHIVVVIRGGGSPEEFSAFDSAEVLQALASKRAFRILGVGHAPNTTVADLVVDHAADTPTAAAVFIRHQLEHYDVLVRGFEDRVQAQRAAADVAGEATQLAHLRQLRKLHRFYWKCIGGVRF